MNKIKDLRLNKGLTQQDISSKAELNVNYYAKIERGEVTPSLKTLQKIVKVLGVKSSDILDF